MSLVEDYIAIFIGVDIFIAWAHVFDWNSIKAYWLNYEVLTHDQQGY